MPVINSLKNTTLKSLRYTGLGPAVQKDINNPPVYNSLSRETEARGDDAARIGRAIIFGSPKFAVNLAQLNAIDQGRNPTPVQRFADDVPRGVESNNIGRFFSEVGKAIRSISNFARDEIDQVASSAVQTPTIIASTLAQVAAESGTHFVYGFGVKGKYIPGSASPHVLAQLQGRIPIPTGFDENRSELKEAWSSLTPKPGANHPLADGNLILGSQLKNPSKVSAYDFVKSKSNDAIGDGVMRDFTRPEDTSTGKAPQKISNEVAKESRVGLSKNRKLTKYTDSFVVFDPQYSDQRNMLEPTKEAASVDDLIKFKFSIINPDEDDNINLYFRAFLSNFTDNYQGSWNSTKYLGRAEDFYTYQGFNRSIGIGFKIAAFSRNELKPIYKKLVMLASTTAPTYSGDNGFMRGTLVTTTVGDYIVDQPGFISTVDYSWQTDYPWEVKLLGNEDYDVQQLPHVLDVSLGFTPIHRFSVQTGQQHFITNPGKGLQGGLNSFLDGLPINQKQPEQPISTEAAIAKLNGETAAQSISKFNVKPTLDLSPAPVTGLGTLGQKKATSGFNSVLKTDFFSNLNSG